MKRVRITQIDGSLPNLALMKLSHWHKAQGDEVHFTRSVDKGDESHIERGLFEPAYDVVYGSAIFKFSQLRLMRFMRQFPDAIVGGTGNLPCWVDVLGREMRSKTRQVGEPRVSVYGQRKVTRVVTEIEEQPYVLLSCGHAERGADFDARGSKDRQRIRCWSCENPKPESAAAPTAG